MQPPRRTATTANALLGMLSLRERWPIYDLTKQLRRNMRFFWPRAESRVYAEARRLVERGLAHQVVEREGGRPRSVYAITPSGRSAIAEWLGTPPRPTTLESEALLRLLVGGIDDAGLVSTVTERLRIDAEEILAVGRVVGREYLDGTAPFQDHVPVRALVFAFLSSYALTLRAWAAEAERAAGRWRALPAEERQREAVRLIGQWLERYPPPP